MDFREKVEARKAELRQQQEHAERERAGRTELVREAARAEAEQRLAKLAPREQVETAKTESPALTPHESQIEEELDKALDKRAAEMWSDGENLTMLLLFLGAIVSFFAVGWLIGLGMGALWLIHLRIVNGKYKRQLRRHLAAA